MKRSIGSQAMPFPAPVWVVGTYDREGNPNMMTAAWVGICSSQPPCVSVSLRKSRYSYNNIIEQGVFTVNIPSVKFVKETDYLGIASGKNEDKLATARLNTVKSEVVNAPVLEEFPVALECKLVRQLELGSHTAFIGEIKDIRVEEEMLDPDGHPDAERIEPFVLFDGYRAIGDFAGKAFSIGKGI